MISQQNISAIIDVAASARIEPAALLAVVEIESRGTPFEADNVTPIFLFERHIFYRELRAQSQAKLSQAVSSGLALRSWSKANYGGLGTSAGKLMILQQARAIDQECANRACSWGVGQVMGFNARSLNYASATQMVTAMSSTGGGFAAQVDGMVRFIKRQGLDQHLASHNWEAFARGYNGSGYAQNQYHTKLRNAYTRWLKVDTGGIGAQYSSPDLIRRGQGENDRVRTLQGLLKGKGYPVGATDGVFGAMTEAAVFSFQSQNKLPATGIVDADTWAKLSGAADFALDPSRANATIDTLLGMGSRTVAGSQMGKRFSEVAAAIGGIGVVDAITKSQSSNREGVVSSVFGNLYKPKETFLTQQLTCIPDQGGQTSTCTVKTPPLPESPLYDVKILPVKQLLCTKDKGKEAWTCTAKIEASQDAANGNAAQLAQQLSCVKRPQSQNLTCMTTDSAATTPPMTNTLFQDTLPTIFKAVPALLDPSGGLPLIASVLGAFMWQRYNRVATARLDDHHKGLNQSR